MECSFPLKLFAMVIWKIYKEQLKKIPQNLREKYFLEIRRNMFGFKLLFDD